MLTLSSRAAVEGPLIPRAQRVPPATPYPSGKGGSDLQPPLSSYFDSLGSRIALRYPRGCTVHVAHPVRSILIPTFPRPLPRRSLRQRRVKAIKAIFFDAGGTLIHLDCRRLSRIFSDELGCELLLDGFSRAQSLAMATVARLAAEGAGTTDTLKRQFYTTLLPEIGLAQDKLNQAVECALRVAQAEMLWCSAEAATAPVLRELKRRGFALGIISNADGRLESSFAQAGLTEHFDFFIDSFVVGVEKPEPAIFRFALEQAGLAPHEAAYVGDIYSVDVLGARRAGLLPILYDPADLNADADCLRIRQLDELLTLFPATPSRHAEAFPEAEALA